MGTMDILAYAWAPGRGAPLDRSGVGEGRKPERARTREGALGASQHVLRPGQPRTAGTDMRGGRRPLPTGWRQSGLGLHSGWEGLDDDATGRRATGDRTLR